MHKDKNYKNVKEKNTKDMNVKEKNVKDKIKKLIEESTRRELRETRQELMEEAAIREDLERENAKLRRVVRRVIVDD